MPRLDFRRQRGHQAGMDLLTILVVVLVLLWLGGYFAFHVTTGFIHLLLVVAVVVLVIRLLRGGRAV